MRERAYLYLSGVIFALVGFAHFARALSRLPVQLGSLNVPNWISWVLGAFALCLGLCGLRLGSLRA